MALNPGDTLLNGQYRIVRLAARGGFGFVYLAEDTLLGESVAIKELIPALVGDEAMLKRFLAEAKATMRLTHKRIVRTHNVFQESGNYYIIMEYMPGGSLEDRLREQGPLPVDEAVRVAVEVAEGLACAHEQKVVHCDLKPANILFDAQGQAKVADFGIAHVSGEMLTRTWHTPAGFVAGTLPYMSPEQTDGVRDDARIDVYALGAMLYRMLTGRTYLEFDRRETPRSQSDNVRRIFREQPKPPSAHNRRVPAWLDGAVLKALAKEPGDRYADAEEMGAVLQRQGTQRQPAPATPPPPRIEPPAQPAPSPTPTPTPAQRKTPRPDAKPAPATTRTSLPSWFWIVAGGAAVLFVALAVAVGVILGGGDGTATPVATLTLATTAISDATPTLAPTYTAVQPTQTPIPTPHAGATRVWVTDDSIMVYVPPGEFTMGSDDGYSDERPVHTVTLDAYYIDKYEVTNAQFRQCVQAGDCQAPTTCDWGEPTYNEAGKADHPVVCVDWAQADAYCTWADKRLPTEAEWEKAARGADARTYPWGDEFDGTAANFCDTNCEFGYKDDDWDDGYARTAPVGRYPSGASPYGAMDMAGNVWEWVADWYDGGYYDVSPGNNPLGPDSGEYKVLRGGSWTNIQIGVRAADRYGGDPTRRSYGIGFRCAGLPGG